MLDLFDINSSRNDFKRGVILPEQLNENLAYFCGFLVGDGHIQFDKINKKYQITICGNPNNEKEFFDNELTKLIKRLFNLNVKPKFLSRDGTYSFIFSSKSIVEFLVHKIKLPFGRKCEIITIPEIFKSSETLTRFFIQGYADADFCLTLKKRYKKYLYYPSIVGTSKSKTIIEEVGNFLNRLGIDSTICKITQDDPRFKNIVTVYRIDINGHINLVKWMKKIGFRNLKYLQNFELWKERNKENRRAREAFSLLLH